jgi:DNA-binding GntR family transcriptional regulator
MKADVTAAEVTAAEALGGAPAVAGDIRIDRPTLHDVVVIRVRDMIIEGTLAAGSRIHEGQLGQQLGISRTPLREALKVLAREGLVDLVQGKGALVRKLTHKDVKDMLVVLSAMEELAGKLACENASDSDIREVRRLHDAMMGYYAVRNRLPYYKLNQEIHSAFIRITGNEALSMVHTQLQARLKRIRFIGNEKPEHWDAAVADHEEMIAALEARDGPRLSRALSDHLAETWLRVADSI